MARQGLRPRAYFESALACDSVPTRKSHPVSRGCNPSQCREAVAIHAAEARRAQGDTKRVRHKTGAAVCHGRPSQPGLSCYPGVSALDLLHERLLLEACRPRLNRFVRGAIEGLPSRVDVGRQIAPQRYARERERIWRRAWLSIGHTQLLPQKGSYFAYDIATFNMSLLVVRGQDGQVRVFHNICRHRGNKLVREGSGSAAANCDAIRCQGVTARPSHGFLLTRPGREPAAEALPASLIRGSTSVTACLSINPGQRATLS